MGGKKMNSENRSHPVLLRWMCLLLAGLALGLVAVAPVHAAKSVAEPVPQPRWNSSSSLQPDSILGDSTYFVGTRDPVDGDTLLYHSLDIEGGYLFTATGQGMQIFNLNVSNPEVLSYIYGYFQGASAFPIWNYSDKDWYIKQMDAPEGHTDVVALTMEEQGFAIVNTQAKDKPKVSYQREVPVSKLYAFNAGAGSYAYASDMNTGVVYLFNLSAAA